MFTQRKPPNRQHRRTNLEMNTFILKQKMFPNNFLVIYCMSGPVLSVTVTINACFYPATMWVLLDIAYFSHIAA